MKRDLNVCRGIYIYGKEIYQRTCGSCECWGIFCAYFCVSLGAQWKDTSIYKNRPESMGKKLFLWEVTYQQTFGDCECCVNFCVSLETQWKENSIYEKRTESMKKRPKSMKSDISMDHRQLGALRNILLDIMCDVLYFSTNVMKMKWDLHLWNGTYRIWKETCICENRPMNRPMAILNIKWCHFFPWRHTMSVFSSALHWESSRKETYI